MEVVDVAGVVVTIGSHALVASVPTVVVGVTLPHNRHANAVLTLMLISIARVIGTVLFIVAVSAVIVTITNPGFVDASGAFFWILAVKLFG